MDLWTFFFWFLCTPAWFNLGKTENAVANALGIQIKDQRSFFFFFNACAAWRSTGSFNSLFSFAFFFSLLLSIFLDLDGDAHTYCASFHHHILFCSEKKKELHKRKKNWWKQTSSLLFTLRSRHSTPRLRKDAARVVVRASAANRTVWHVSIPFLSTFFPLHLIHLWRFSCLCAFAWLGWNVYKALLRSLLIVPLASFLFTL